MKIIKYTALVAASLMAVSTTSYAESKPWPHISWGWDYEEGQNYDFVPYKDSAKSTHMSQWDQETPWSPEVWAAQHDGDARKVLKRFFASDILRDRYEDDDVEVLVVGPNFYRLSSYDQRRVVEFTDYVYRLSDTEASYFVLEDWASEKRLGTFTATYGLQYQ